MLARRVEDNLEDIDGQPIFWRSAPGEGTPVLYLHGVPTSSDDWVPLLARTGGGPQRIARAWRTRLLGELVRGGSNRWLRWRLSGEASAPAAALPREFVDEVWTHFDQGTQRAILKLYRSAPPDVLAQAGRRLA